MNIRAPGTHGDHVLCPGPKVEVEVHGRVAGALSAPAPTDPDVRHYRIRLFEIAIHLVLVAPTAECTTRGRGSGYRRSRLLKRCQVMLPR